jgi:hypothetical protein
VASLSEGSPDLPDGVVRDAELESDLGESLAVEAASNDLVADRHRQCGRHGGSSGEGSCRPKPMNDHNKQATPPT